MGREAQCDCRWNERTGAVKVLLEADELILRGELKAKFPRSQLSCVETVGDELRFRVGADRVALELGADIAARWAKAIATAPPDLAKKLGIDAGVQVKVIGKIDEPELAAAVGVAAISGTIGVLIAEVAAESELVAALQVHAKLDDPIPPIWIVYRKGAKSPFGEVAVRQVMREAGFIDTKAANVSARSTASKFIRR